ncbi:MAG TPA: hypothetical protein VIH58_04375, partial [Chthoniobacterales bacterium]
SQGRGFITQERVEEMETIAARHGIYLAPLYNADGPVEAGLDCQTEWFEDQRMGEGTGGVTFAKWDEKASVGPVGGA